MIALNRPPGAASELTEREWSPTGDTSTPPPSALLTALNPLHATSHHRGYEMAIRVRLEAQGPTPWLTEVVARLRHLLVLPPNWDSYSAPPVTRQAVVRAIEVLVDTMTPRTPAPQIVPTHEGGLQLEWHDHSVDLEVEISRAGQVAASFEDQADGTEWERDLNADFGLLAEALLLLTFREVKLKGV